MEEVETYRGSSQIVSYELNPTDVMEQIRSIQSLMSTAMKEGEHYGTIPGCGDKPTLLKAGAEKLTFMFRLAPKYDIQETNLEKGHKEYRVVTELIHIPTGKFFGQGVGTCTTMESKYRYRDNNKKCPECGKETIIKGKAEYGGGWLCFAKKGGCGAKFKDDDKKITEQQTGKVEYDNPADYYNTVLKMAKKRSLVDATLTSTAASDIFIQDVEEMVENGVLDAHVVSETKTEKKTSQQASNEPTEQNKPAKRNYTAEAEACLKSPDYKGAFKIWWNALTPKEKKDFDGLKNNILIEIEKLDKKNEGKNIIKNMINNLTADNWKRDHKRIEDLIDREPVTLRNEYSGLYFKKQEEIGVNNEYMPIPF